MLLLQTPVPNSFSSPFSPINAQPYSVQFSSISTQTPVHYRRLLSRHLPCFAVSKKSDSNPEPPESSSNSKAKPKTRTRRPRPKAEDSTNNDEGSGYEGEDPGTIFPRAIPRKPRRGRRSEAVAVEDFVRDQLERTFASIRQHNPGVLEGKENIFKDKVDDSVHSETSDDEADEEEDEDENHADGDVGKVKGKKKKMVVEEESQDWPLDADVGWGTRASEYFEKHPIKNVVADDGVVEIDWEGEMDDNWVNEINCLDWERFAFHPSPLVVLVFERYNRATDNWKILKELEKAAKVYRNAKDRLPPRTVKLDINIERDLAYALKVKECPQILFLRGNKILYREKGICNCFSCHIPMKVWSWQSSEPQMSWSR